MVVAGLLAIWALFTLIGLAVPSLQQTIFAVGSCICVPAILFGGLSCMIKVVATDPLGALTTLVLGTMVGGPFAPRVGRLARETGLPGVHDQDMGCAGTLLVAGMVGELLLLVNLLLVYVL
jgi:hypothetical protein